jgi:DNA repair protein RecO (recombination protein O)
MSRSTRRVQLAPGYLLHHRPWRDSSRILEVFTREHGRLTLFARAVRGPAARLAPVLQPFQPLLLSWSGRGEAPHLSGAERAQPGGTLPAGCVLAGFYLNELLLKLTTRHDPIPEIYDAYHGTLAALRGGELLQARLRVFEKRLLEALGYGLELATEAGSAVPIEPGRYYEFRPGQGLVRAREADCASVSGHSLRALAQEELEQPRELLDARRVLQAALAQVLEGRPLATQTVARSMKRRAMQ